MVTTRLRIAVDVYSYRVREINQYWWIFAVMGFMKRDAVQCDGKYKNVDLKNLRYYYKLKYNSA